MRPGVFAMPGVPEQGEKADFRFEERKNVIVSQLNAFRAGCPPSLQKRRKRRIRCFVQRKMLKRFLARDLSAAGIAHVVTEKSPLRRLLWIAVLLLICVMMLSMTYNVLQEYLKYPTFMLTVSSSLKVMEFPAVTVCGYSLIPRHDYKEAKLQHMVEMERLLHLLPRYNISVEEKVNCLKDPLCRWSRFLDQCQCCRKACESTECYAHASNRSLCSCSESLCEAGVDEIARGCSKTVQRGKEGCVCRTDFEYPRSRPPTNSSLSRGFLEAVESLRASQDVKNLLMTLKRSNVSNLRDVEQFLRPNISLRDNYGMAYEDLFLSCTFGSQPCNERRDVSTVYSPSFGKCYSFNYAGEEEHKARVKTVKHAGKDYGLQLLLKFPIADTLPLLSAHHGARVVVHEPRSLPFASDNGFDVRTDDSTSVMVQYAEVNRLGPPWNDCAVDGDNSTTSYLARPYSEMGCWRKCLNRNVFKRCRCYDERLYSGTLTPVRGKTCKQETDACTNHVVLDIIKNLSENRKILCRCPPPCREKRYDVVSMSASSINREFYRLLKMVRTLKLVNGRPTVARPEFRQGMFGIHVYFGSFAVSNTTEQSMYSLQYLVSNIGGNMGLFLGLSLITFVEIAEFLVDSLIALLCRRSRRIGAR